MLTKFFTLWSHPGSSGAKALQGVDLEKFEAFYSSLATQINSLEKKLGQESNFSLAWILVAMDFVRALHLSVYTLIEEVWFPMRKTVGMDVVETYFDVSVMLLDICNYLRDGVSALEYSQLSLEHCLESLGGLVGSLVHAEGADEFVAAKKVLESCRLELQEIESKKTPNLWVEMKSQSKTTGGKSSSSSKSRAKPEVSSLERSHSVLPSPSLRKNAFRIAQVMVDGEVVITFISTLLVWVLTDTSEQFSFLHDFDGPSFAPGVADEWSAALLRLRDRIENSELKHKKSNCALFLKEIRVVHDAVRDLMELVESEVRQGVEAAAGTDRSEILRAALEQSREKLHDMIQVSDRLSQMTHDVFSEILHCQEKIMEIVENQLTRSVTI